MINIICAFLFLLLSQSAFSFQFDLLNSDEVLFLEEETKEISTVSDIEFPAGLQKDLQKTKIISRSNFRFFTNQIWPIREVSEVDQEVIPNLNIAKIIYPFHSFL